MSSSANAMVVDRPEMIDVDNYFATLLSSSPSELHPLLDSLRTLHQRKLWHQLTLKLFEFFQNDHSKPYRVDVFEKFVRNFEERLNQLKLAELGVIASHEIDNPATHLNFLKSLVTRINTEKPSEANVLLLSSTAHAKLLYGDLEGTRTDLDSAWKILDDLDGVDPAVNATYYLVSADYYKAKEDFGPYYKNSLLYLACIDPATDLTEEGRMMRAHDLSVAALIADDIYNFGELLMHPILSSLDGTQYEWIKKLLFAFNAGDIGKYEALIPLFPKEPILQQKAPFLRQKMCLMALVETVFKRNADSRTISFQTIAEETRLNLDEVDLFVMKAFCLELLRGSINGINQTVHITWVQPRVLDNSQINALIDRLGKWTDKLKTVEQRIAQEMFHST